MDIFEFQKMVFECNYFEIKKLDEPILAIDGVLCHYCCYGMRKGEPLVYYGGTKSETLEGFRNLVFGEHKEDGVGKD